MCIDRKIYGLIKFLNSLPCVCTLWSCEGEERHKEGYVVLRGESSDLFILEWMKECGDVARIKVSYSEYNDGWHVTWMKWRYLRVLRAARRAAKTQGLTK